jgi:hypothetical protein
MQHVLRPSGGWVCSAFACWRWMRTGVQQHTAMLLLSWCCSRGSAPQEHCSVSEPVGAEPWEPARAAALQLLGALCTLLGCSMVPASCGQAHARQCLKSRMLNLLAAGGMHACTSACSMAVWLYSSCLVCDCFAPQQQQPEACTLLFVC